MDDTRDLLMRGRLDKLKERRARLRTKIKNQCETITINSFIDIGIEKIDPAAVLEAAQELNESYAEYMNVSAEIARLEG